MSVPYKKETRGPVSPNRHSDLNLYSTILDFPDKIMKIVLFQDCEFIVSM